MSHLLISASHKSSGKTTIAMGLCAALRERGLAVQPFKKGPDYIDALWLSLAAGRDCHNLDFHTMQRTELVSTFTHFARHAAISLIEGNKGLHDGVSVNGSNSNAALATALNSPVVLVIDTRGMTRGIAPLILGYQSFDANVHIAGLILNQVGGPRHEGKLRAAIEYYTDVPVLGAVARDSDLAIAERHIGLVPANELSQAATLVERLKDAVCAQVDLDRLLAVAQQAKLPDEVHRSHKDHYPNPDVRLGIAHDAAFGFYYPDDLEGLRAAGAELVPIDTLRDSALPDIDGLFIGGGFPELHMEALQSNRTLRVALRKAIRCGLPVYAECGGLMYLARRIRSGDARGKS